MLTFESGRRCSGSRYRRGSTVSGLVQPTASSPTAAVACGHGCVVGSCQAKELAPVTMGDRITPTKTRTGEDLDAPAHPPQPPQPMALPNTDAASTVPEPTAQPRTP